MLNLREAIPIGLLVIVCCLLLYLIVPTCARHYDTRHRLGELQQQLGEQQLEIQRLRKDLSDLRTDYRAVERVAREKFGFCRDDEKVYHFEAQPKADRAHARP